VQRRELLGAPRRRAEKPAEDRDAGERGAQRTDSVRRPDPAFGARALDRRPAGLAAGRDADRVPGLRELPRQLQAAAAAADDQQARQA
jgi:hypothetical protein